MKILVADPSRTAQRIFSELLTNAGHRPLAAFTGVDAIAALTADDTIDVLLTSFELPDISGLELCWEARLLSEERNPLYVVAMSASRDETSVAKALDSGADDFIGKPPSRTELFARLRAAERVIRAQNELIRIANVDVLTDLPNRRAFFARAAHALRHADEEAAQVAAVVFDVDHFKSINDRFGHDVGDAVLKGIADVIRATGLPAARVGGEEFAAIVEATPAAAAAAAEALRAAVAAKGFAVGDVRIAATISLGVAPRSFGMPVDILLKRADVALYAAKQGGRNRVVVSADEADVVR